MGRPEHEIKPHLSRAISDCLPISHFHDAGGSGNNSSDEEWNREIEVEFDMSESARRRKSSVVEQSNKFQRPRLKSQCLLHKNVEDTTDGKQPKTEQKLPNIDEVDHGVKEENGGAQQDKSNMSEEAIDDSALSVYPNTISPRKITESHMKEEIRATHSRLLTKKQLSDMAVSVRSMAKRLSNLKVKLKIRTIFLLTKIHDPTLIRKTKDVTQWLLSKDRNVAYTVYVQDTMKDNKDFDAQGIISGDSSVGDRLKYWNESVCKKHPHTFDFVITLGGDGTVLFASWLFQRVVPPVLSFALGSLGFLTKFDFDEYQDTLTKAFRDGVTISLRLRFEGTIMRSQKQKHHQGVDLVEELMVEEAEGHVTHKPDRTFEILNDVVVDRGPNPTMSTIELFGDEEHLTTVQADGICVATPTGSTAYNLAAGGSLCHPENPVILVTAICAHTLSFRPIILPDTIVLRLGVPYDARANSWVSFDGRERVELCPGDYVTISASRYPFANVMPPGRRSEDWVNSISRTLQWNSRQRQKAYQDIEDKVSRRKQSDGKGNDMEDSQKDGQGQKKEEDKAGKDVNGAT